MIKKIIFLSLLMGLMACSSLQQIQNNYHDEATDAEIQNDNLSDK